MKRIAFTLLLFALFTNSLYAQEENTKVRITSTSEDMVGQRLVYFLKEEVRRSASLELVNSNANGAFEMNVVTLDSDSQNSGYSTTYSVTWTYNHPSFIFPLYLDQVVGYSGSSRIEEAAESITAQTVETVETTLDYVQSIQAASQGEQ